MRHPTVLILVSLFALACDGQDPVISTPGLDAVVADAPNHEVWPTPPLYVDQSNPVPAGGAEAWRGCGTQINRSLQQTFTPTVIQISGVYPVENQLSEKHP